MKVRVLYVVLLLSVPALVLANPPFGGGTDRVVNDPLGGGATIYHSDGSTSRYNPNPLGGGATIHHSGGGTTRIVNDQIGGGSTMYHSSGGTTRYNPNPLGGGGTVYQSGGGMGRLVSDPLGGGATLHRSDGSTSRYTPNPLGGGGTIHHSGGGARSYGAGGDAFGFGANASGVRPSTGSSFSRPSYSSPAQTYSSPSYIRPTYSSPSYSSPSYSAPSYGIPSTPNLGAEISPVDMPLNSYQSGSSSRPVIDGYRRIGEEPSGGSSFGDAAAAAAAEIALKAIIEAGFRSAQQHFNTQTSYADDSSPYESGNRQIQKTHCPFRVFLIIVLIVGALCLWASKKNKEVSRLCKKVLSIPATVINRAFGRKCETERDSQGELVSVKMPKSVKIPLIVTYVVCALPSVIALFSTDNWIAWVAWLTPLLIPMSLSRGKVFARRVVVFFWACVIVIAVLVRALTEEECGELAAWLCFDGIVLFSCSLIAMLRLPQSNEWFLAKREMSRAAIRKVKDGIKAKADRIFGSAVFVFAGKWYVWIAAVLIVICFVVIFRGLFSPLPSKAPDAAKHRMAHEQRERQEQTDKPDAQEPAALP